MTKTLLFLKGIPGSGKSTFAKELLEKEPGKWVRTNKDDIRASCFAGAPWNKKIENLVVDIHSGMISAALSAGYGVLSDNTHCNPVHEAEQRKIAQAYGARFEVKFFDVPVEECIRRDALREKPVGEKVIKDMAARYAVASDMDGTLAIFQGRSPYDHKACGSDLVNKSVATVLDALEPDHEIISVSGRTDDSREETEAWLIKNGISYDKLLMRKTGDKRPDEIVKKEIYDEHIRGHYNCVLWIDDRPKVCRMIRALGLPLFQVGDGHEF